MTAREQEAITTALVQLAEALDAPMSEMRIAAYLVALADLDARAVVAALTLQLRTATFFPRPAEIRQAVAGGSTDDAADLAWGMCCQPSAVWAATATPGGCWMSMPMRPCWPRLAVGAQRVTCRWTGPSGRAAPSSSAASTGRPCGARLRRR